MVRGKNLRTLLLMVLCLALTGCGKKKDVAAGERLVLVQTVENGHGQNVTTYPGRTQASEEANVAFRVAGTLLHVTVKEGQRVRRGQVIARMDDRDYRVQLTAAEAEYTQVKAEAERVMALYADSVATANNYDKARYGLQQITQKLQHCRDQVDDCLLRAPFDGYVRTVLHESHETVAAGMPIVGLIADGQTEVVINIPTSENLRRSEFADFTAHFDVLPDEQFPLQLLSIARQANTNQLYEVRLGLKGNHPQITPGMSTLVQLTYRSEGENPIRVPLRAVMHDATGPTTVFVYEKGHLRRTQVELGRAHGDGTVEVNSGLKSGDQIVVAGVNSLSDGEAVRPTGQPSKTNVGGLL
ncbi:MAG: efflux RND transporter periplasmic adaptor subunit [Bacteroidaceae bacterium]|nr:efflux RND transporter periplasmic adaptor subunit [Bacteroidaceae bacterium]